MEAKIGLSKLLNCSKEDKKGLGGLLEEYLFEHDRYTNRDQAEGESCLNDVGDDNDESADNYDNVKYDLDAALDTAKEIRYDTIRDAILTCARKPTQVGLIYRMETTTKNCKREKLHTHTHTPV